MNGRLPRRAVYYHRTSANQTAADLVSQLEKVANLAQTQGLEFDWSPDQAEEIVRLGVTKAGNVYSDSADENEIRRGLTDLQIRVGRDLSVTHVLTLSRDRLARADDLLTSLEYELRAMGVKVVYLLDNGQATDHFAFRDERDRVEFLQRCLQHATYARVHQRLVEKLRGRKPTGRGDVR